MTVACQKPYSLTIPGSPPPSLYWPFEDAAPPPWIDKVQGFALSPTVGIVTQTPGKIGNGVHLNGASPFVALGDIGGVLNPYSQLAYAGKGFTYITWFQQPTFTTLQANPQLFAFSFWNTLANTFATAFALWENFGGNGFGVVLNAPGFGTLVAQQPTFPWGDNVWHFFAVTYDGVAGILKYRVDNNPYVFNTVGTIWGLYTGQASYVLPVMPYGKFAFEGGGGSNGDTRFDESGLWLGFNLTDAQIDFWWNFGLGHTFP